MLRAYHQQIRDEVLSIAAFDELEREHISETLRWIDSGTELCRVEKPATPPQHLVSYFVGIDAGHVLLVDHRKAELWLPPGGHVEPGEHPRDTVLREAREELGIDAEFWSPRPLLLSQAQTRGDHDRHVDVSFWYVLRISRAALLQPDWSEFHSVRWFAFDEVPHERSDPHMPRFLRKLGTKLAPPGPRRSA